MEHPRTESERELAHDTHELERRIEDLDEHIEEARHKLEARQHEADAPLEATAGDWEDESEGAQRGG